MPPHIYHIIHIVGLTILFAGFGGLLSRDESARKTAMKLHGIGLLIMLIAAFGFIASTNKGTPGAFSYSSPFVMVKGVIFLLMGALPVFAKKKVLSPIAVILIAVLLAGIADYIGLVKPLAIH